MKNVKKLAALVILTSALSGFSVAFGADPVPAARPVEGSWGMQQAANGFTFDMTFTIENNVVSITNLCSFQGHSATAHVSSPAQIDDRTITTIASADDQESRDGVNCNVSIKPDRMNYQVAGSQLILSHDGSPEQIVLSRK
jgi:hypothetical protein